MNGMLSAYAQASKRLLLLDYDGVLVPIAPTPEEAAPTQQTYDVLQRLTADPRNECVIISGRPRETLHEWFGDLPLALVAEHGLWRKELAGQWERAKDVTSSWKPDIQRIMVHYQDIMPGSFIEEKHAGLGFHYRSVALDAQANISQLIKALQPQVDRLSLTLMHGKKVVEIIPAGIGKGVAATFWLNKTTWDFVLCVGDDVTDETMFKVMPASAYSIKVGQLPTAARFSIPTQPEFVDMLRQLTSEG